jgi:hypothetical protein
VDQNFNDISPNKDLDKFNSFNHSMKSNLKRPNSRKKSALKKSPLKVKFSNNSPIKPYVKAVNPTTFLKKYEVENGKLDVEKLKKSGIWK